MCIRDSCVPVRLFFEEAGPLKGNLLPHFHVAVSFGNSVLLFCTTILLRQRDPALGSPAVRALVSVGALLLSLLYQGMDENSVHTGTEYRVLSFGRTGSVLFGSLRSGTCGFLLPVLRDGILLHR